MRKFFISTLTVLIFAMGVFSLVNNNVNMNEIAGDEVDYPGIQSPPFPPTLV